MCLDSPAPVFNCGPCPHCNSFKTERNGYCATYNADQRKAERQALKDASKVKKPIRKVSKKQAKELQDYSIQRRQFLAGHPECEARVAENCDGDACEVHHSAKRGKNLLNVETFIAACRPCHRYIEDVMSSDERREKGLLRTVEGTI
jgi:hypothetical protein